MEVATCFESGREGGGDVSSVAGVGGEQLKKDEHVLCPPKTGAVREASTAAG